MEVGVMNRGHPGHACLASYYAARAAEYDRVYLKPERQADLRQIERWLPKLLTSAHVLEVACGTGHWAQFIAPEAASVLAIDAAPPALQMPDSASLRRRTCGSRWVTRMRLARGAAASTRHSPASGSPTCRWRGKANSCAA
ncbi:MAG: class I SAM-dependent methyltransferase [Burkholderiaceae bacterium]